MPSPSIVAHAGRLAVAACTVLLAACAASGSKGAGRVALVIGNAAYEHVERLTNPAHDATDMCAALRRVGFKTLCHTNVRDRAEFDAVVTEYVRQLGPQTVGVVYYSGHGVQAGSAYFLAPTRAEPKAAGADPFGVLYGVDALYERLRQAPPRFQLVILDACRDELFGRAQRPNARVSASLARIQDAPPATLVLYATASGENAFDGDGRNGPLTQHILRHIETRGLPVGDFIARVIQGVENDTQRHYGKAQTPFYYGSFGGTFCFAGCPGDLPPVPVLN